MNKKNFDKFKKLVYEELLESPTPRRPKKTIEKKSVNQSSSGRKILRKEHGVCSECETELILPYVPCTVRCPGCGATLEFSHE